jgi:mono/diheme cytochrome c family protein
MNARSALLFAVPLVVAAGVAGAALFPRSAAEAEPSAVARGRYIVNGFGCMDCHTPLKMGPNGPERDHARAFSGHPEGKAMSPAPRLEGPWMASLTDTMTAWSGPWGTSFTANLTPDEETGLGRWTADTFVQTIRTGRHLGKGRPILPPMPIEPISNLTDDDLRAVFAYLRSLPAIRNRVPEPIPPPESR